MQTYRASSPLVTVSRVPSAPMWLPTEVQEHADAYKLAIDSALQGEAFLAIRADMDRRRNSIAHVFGSLSDNATKVKGELAWFVENRFGVDMYLRVQGESYGAGVHSISMWLAIKLGDHFQPVAPFLVVHIKHE